MASNRAHMVVDSYLAAHRKGPQPSPGITITPTAHMGPQPSPGKAVPPAMSAEVAVDTFLFTQQQSRKSPESSQKDSPGAAERAKVAVDSFLSGRGGTLSPRTRGSKQVASAVDSSLAARMSPPEPDEERLKSWQSEMLNGNALSPGKGKAPGGKAARSPGKVIEAAEAWVEEVPDEAAADQISVGVDLSLAGKQSPSEPIQEHANTRAKAAVDTFLSSRSPKSSQSEAGAARKAQAAVDSFLSQKGGSMSKSPRSPTRDRPALTLVVSHDRPGLDPITSYNES